MGGEELFRVGPFLLCLWKKNVDGSLSLVIVYWSFRKGIMGKKMYFCCCNTKGVIPNMTMTLCIFFYFLLFFTHLQAP
jgi:hypothetical protein